MSKVKRIRPSLGFTRLLHANLLTRARTILASMVGNAAYPNPPFLLAVFETILQQYADAISAALDGSKKAIAERQKLRDEVLSKLRLLGAYVEAACNGDLSVLLSSGFEAASGTRFAPQPLPVPTITRVDQGNSGQLLINIKAVPKAQSYELRHAPLEPGGAPGPWTTTFVAVVKQATPIANLTPGTVFSFQVRAVNRAGYTDWSDAVKRMCI
jgi:hypothetical protein